MKTAKYVCSGCGAHGAMDPEEMLELMHKCVPCSIDMERGGQYFNNHVEKILEDAIRNHGELKVKLALEKYKWMEV